MAWRTLKQGHSVKENHFYFYFIFNFSSFPTVSPNLASSFHNLIRHSEFNYNGTV